MFEVGFYRTKNARNPKALARPKKIQKPARRWEFIVINERDKIARGVTQRFIARQGDIFSRLDCVYDLRSLSEALALAFLDNCTRRLGRVVIDDDN
jgi:hypothetical protein